MAKRILLDDMLDLAREFVIEHKGAWNHVDWESLLAKAAILGMNMNDENKRQLGNLIESCKVFYCNSSVCTGATSRKILSTKSKGKTKI